MYVIQILCAYISYIDTCVKYILNMNNVEKTN